MFVDGAYFSEDAKLQTALENLRYHACTDADTWFEVGHCWQRRLMRRGDRDDMDYISVYISILMT